MTYKELVLKFMKDKNKLVKKEAGIALFDRSDYARYRALTEEKCRDFAAQVCASYAAIRMDDSTICLDCYLHKGNDGHLYCENCEYGDVHGICGMRPASNYCKILSSADVPAILHIFDMEELVRTFIKEVKPL